MPKGPLLIATLAVIVALGLIGAIGAAISVGTSSSSSSSTTQPVAHNDDRAYDMGYDSGQGGLALQLSQIASQEAACRSSYTADLVDQELEDKVFEVSWEDYLRGCLSALGSA